MSSKYVDKSITMKNISDISSDGDSRRMGSLLDRIRKGHYILVYSDV